MNNDVMRTFWQWFSGTYLALWMLAVTIGARLISDAEAHDIGVEMGRSLSGILLLLWFGLSFFGAIVIFAYAIKAPPSSSRAPGARSLSPRS